MSKKMSLPPFKWSQTADSVIIKLYLKDALIKHQRNRFQVEKKRRNVRLISQSEFNWKLQLYSAIKPNESFYKITANKVVITLIKEVPKTWTHLDYDKTIGKEKAAEKNQKRLTFTNGIVMDVSEESNDENEPPANGQCENTLDSLVGLLDLEKIWIPKKANE